MMNTNTNLYESRLENTTNIDGKEVYYTDNSFPTANDGDLTVFSVNYYDKYLVDGFTLPDMSVTDPKTGEEIMRMPNPTNMEDTVIDGEYLKDTNEYLAFDILFYSYMLRKMTACV